MWWIFLNAKVANLPIFYLAIVVSLFCMHKWRLVVLLLVKMTSLLVL